MIRWKDCDLYRTGFFRDVHHNLGKVSWITTLILCGSSRKSILVLSTIDGYDQRYVLFSLLLWTSVSRWLNGIFTTNIVLTTTLFDALRRAAERNYLSFITQHFNETTLCYNSLLRPALEHRRAAHFQILKNWPFLLTIPYLKHYQASKLPVLNHV